MGAIASAPFTWAGVDLVVGGTPVLGPSVVGTSGGVDQVGTSGGVDPVGTSGGVNHGGGTSVVGSARARR